MDTSEASSSSPTHDEILSLLVHRTYDPNIVVQLEQYLSCQLQNTQPYVLDANRTLLKLYQFFPHLRKDGDGVVSNILFLSLLQFPDSAEHIGSLRCLIPERVQSKEPCATIVRCAELLDNCQLAEFWTTYHTLPSVISETASAESLTVSNNLLIEAASSPITLHQLRTSILALLSYTYRVAPLSVLLTSLDLASADAVGEFLKTLEKEEKGEVCFERMENDGSVVFKPTEQNTARTEIYEKSIGFGDVASVLGSGLGGKLFSQ